MHCIYPAAPTSLFFANKDGESGQGIGQGCFAFSHRLISVGAVLDHVDPGHSCSSDIYFSEVLRPQSRNLPPTCPHCFCAHLCPPLFCRFGMFAGAVLTTFLRALRTVYVLQGQNLILGAKNCMCSVQSVFQRYG